MRQRLAALAAAAIAATQLVLACADSDDSTTAGTGGDAGSKNDGGVGQPSDAGSVGAASGVVVLHAAAFPAFRLCFENYPDLPPQPDAVLMPEANVVGVEVGSVVRIGALSKVPGKVYVIDQREVRASPRDPTERTCGELLADKAFRPNIEYQRAGELTEPLGVGKVDVLAITGCGGAVFLDPLDADGKDCTDWDPTSGSLRARTVTLLPTIPATTTKLPVQLVMMSAQLDRERANGQALDLTFGALDANAPPQPLDVPPLFEAGAPVTLDVQQDLDPFFGTHGFRIALRPSSSDDAGVLADAALPPPSFVVEQSLAEVQELSSPQTLPTTYYKAASNYALLLLGDPRIQRTLGDGGANAGYDPRRAVHLLAVPVKEPEDAGAPALDADASPTRR